MKIYIFDRLTREYLATQELTKNSDGKYYPPAFSTLKPVISASANKTAVFDLASDSWVIVDDYRGYSGFDSLGNEQVINSLGIVPNPSWSVLKPFVLADAKIIKTQEIEASFNSALTTVSAINITWHSGIETAQRLDGARRLAEMAGLTLVDFTDVNRATHSLSIADAVKVILAVGGDFQTKFMKKQKLLVDVANATNQIEIDAIVW